MMAEQETQQTLEQAQKFFQNLKLEAQESSGRNIYYTPGGPLFPHLDELSDIIKHLSAEDRVNYAGIEMRGDVFNLVLEFYKRLESSGSTLLCMDPRLDNPLNVSGSTAHEHCGACSVATTSFTINGENVFPNQEGQDIEDTLIQRLGQDKLPVIAGTETGHQDNGIVLSFTETTYGVSQEQKEEALKQRIGIPYHISLPVKTIQEFITSNNLEGEQRQAFINALVELNVGLAIQIATTHNQTPIENTGFHIMNIVPNGEELSDDENELLNSLKEAINKLYQNGLEHNGSSVGVYTYEEHIN